MSKQYSIITNDFNKCFICNSYHWIEVHHVFGAANRNKSTQYGLVVPLCHYCHNEPPNGVHHNKANRLALQQLAQTKFEEVYPNLDFRKIFGKSYK